mmetsp:Transcript_17393/g.20872  ORF Transcript_17393/g.20872 Transcript_17393/m.20872 type:complete len:360 (-) Transcript_17393:398-1477(-)|eukprot:CAMPEP_0197844346 /NCGR_PEP_ID=MMETSP1438-20131217/1330_1 /TAXON_ID=1461541 /ORGANISM="Pterosperma sp., Strain CCMP1384" /LENGTH=359 /DNA_ID=CAMNT_0043455085 /DNA_START=107 /DNA_END=1186 /DNA_ORIENTATION=-
MEGNTEAGIQFYHVARKALYEEGDAAKAVKLAEKAVRLCPALAPRVEEIIQAARSGDRSRASGPQASPRTPAGSSNTTRQRPRNDQAEETRPDLSTPEQRSQVSKILSTNDYYEIFGVTKNAGEDEIKKAYRKLALKLHPDKNKAPRAEEAFKKVSKAFECLSNDDKRAVYDRYGSEEPPQYRASSGRSERYYQEEEIDPFELFNMFFGGGIPQQQRRRTHQGARHQQHYQQQHHQQQFSVQNLLQMLPILLLFFFSLFPAGDQPVYSLKRSEMYPLEKQTTRAHVNFYVRNGPAFEEEYQKGTERRVRLETRIEYEYKDILEQLCHYERIQQKKFFRWGEKERARNMQLPHCQELAAF